ncbi:MAG: glycosyltransferase [Candidatus Omnitrophica bacterium]|nr:glycosyltransferase [Candidatus Omnitrophota bacterium]
MKTARILLMYISENSGHHRACLAIEKALHQLSDDVETLNVNSFNYTNPILEKIIGKTYMSVIRRKPEVWGYIYDNPNVVRRTQKLKEAIHRYNSNKMRTLLESYKPRAIICTQAFPCGIIADYKKTSDIGAMLSGVLTDYAPHSYWLYDSVDAYFVPSEETKERLVTNGIARERIKFTGIPIDPIFKKIIDKKKVLASLGLDGQEPVVLIMGGSQGLGPISETIKVLGNSSVNFQIIVAAGGNKGLYRRLKRVSARFKKKCVVLGYANNIDELMEISSIIITKPGGITISEALAKGLAALIIKPIPGHEEMNTSHLVKHRVAIRIDKPQDAEMFVKELLGNPRALKNMQERARAFSRPDSALDIARTVLERIM